MTPEQQAVIDAATAWATDYAEDPDSWAGPDRVLIDAVRALTPPEPELPPEDRSVPWIDKDGDVWTYHLATDDWGAGWYVARPVVFRRDWRLLNATYGPLTRLYLDVAELVAALRGDSRAICRETHDGPVDSCPIPSCSDRRALLARFGEAS